MDKENIVQIITQSLEQNDILKGCQKDQDFFDLGASSLTIVDLQIQIESIINIKVKTTELMSKPTINGWADLYTASSGSQGKMDETKNAYEEA